MEADTFSCFGTGLGYSPQDGSCRNSAIVFEKRRIMQKTGLIWAVIFTMLSMMLVISCEKDSIENEEELERDFSQLPSFTGSSSGYEVFEPFYSPGTDVQFSVTHAEDSNFALYIVDATTGEVVDALIYDQSVTDETTLRYVPPGDYWVEVEAAGNWTFTLTGNIHLYQDPNNLETDSSLYVGCGEGCCEGRGGVIGCDCTTGECICADDTVSLNCTECECIGYGDMPSPEPEPEP